MHDLDLEKKRSSIQKEEINGVDNTSLNEELPVYNIATSEKVIEGKNNTSIVLGRDRPGDISSGYGGRGEKRSGAIDFVVGRTSSIIKEFSSDGKKTYTNPSIPYDAARITLSQKTDVDDNFYLPGENIKGKSAVAVKADNIRIIAREGIKLVTNSDKYDSNGNLKIQKYGVSLIANDGEKIQPIPKGENLESTIKDLYQKISEQQIAGIMKVLMQIFGYLIVHTHPTPTGISGPSPDLGINLGVSSSHVTQMLLECQLQQINIEMSRLKYLSPGSEHYINSLFHKLD